MPANPAITPALRRRDYRLGDNLWARQGQVFITGTQALVRLPLMQRWLDEAAGLDTRGFVSGYRGSPLGMVDQQIWKAGTPWKEAGLTFVPAINEELAATQVLGTQRVESDPEKTCDAVFALWYGKGPGVDRAGDALKHGNAYGSSPHGGVLVVAGDDHGCVSSSMPHQSDQLFQAFHMPIVAPANVAEHLEFGLYGWALSRFSGHWVGLTSLSEVVESGATVDLDAIHARVAAWKSADDVGAATGFMPPAQGLHYRWPDLPSLQIEERLAHKLRAVAAFSAVNSIDRQVIESPLATVGIVTCGKAHYDLMEVLRRLDLSPQMLADAGVRLYKVGLSFPIETTRMQAVAQGLREILVIEEKGAVVEAQLRDLFYNAPVRPVILGKRDAGGQPLVSSLGELRPSRLIELTADWLIRHFPDRFADRRALVRDFTLPELLSNESDSVKRLPYFCAGCPHNTSTKVPEGSSARAGIGCHFMANWMDRETAGLIQMGGEGVDWVSHAMFTRKPHVFQNLGDGTYYHSGYLAIRQAVAAKARITYKILFNDAVAMTGGQPVDGVISVDAIARQVESEGVKKVVVLSDDIGQYDGQKARFPHGTEFFDRDQLDRVQRELREIDGVTVLIYEQTCAAEKRRRRKKGELVDPDKRLFINEAVCEGCGDCSVQSNCLSVEPLETEFGRKRTINQSTCNKDTSCLKGFCPSFITVEGGQLKKKAKAKASVSPHELGALPEPVQQQPAPGGAWGIVVAGVGGTGVITIGQLLGMAAHMEGKGIVTQDAAGLAQKGGATWSHVLIGDTQDDIRTTRVGMAAADLILGCDPIVAANKETMLRMREGRTHVALNSHGTPTAAFVKDGAWQNPSERCAADIARAVGPTGLSRFDADAVASQLLGDTLYVNPMILGYAWQKGWVPLRRESLLRAMELNNVQVENNKAAFEWGRQAAHDFSRVEKLLTGTAGGAQVIEFKKRETLESIIARRVEFLTGYQDAAYADQYRDFVAQVQQAESRLGGKTTLSEAVARYLFKLMAYKDEYEVARLHSDPAFQQRIADMFEGDYRINYHLAPPMTAERNDKGELLKKKYGPSMLRNFKLLAKLKGLRGGALDIFGKTEERQTERALIQQYRASIEEVLKGLSSENHATAVEIARIPEQIKGYGHVKERNLKAARTRWAELMAQYRDPQAARQVA